MKAIKERLEKLEGGSDQLPIIVIYRMNTEHEKRELEHSKVESIVYLPDNQRDQSLCNPYHFRVCQLSNQHNL